MKIVLEILRNTYPFNYTEYNVFVNGNELYPDESLKLRNHSPDGFSVGYHGSGCAQLALAILLRITDQETAISKYQDFKSKVISQLDRGGFTGHISIPSHYLNIIEKDPFLSKENDDDDENIVIEEIGIKMIIPINN